MSIIVKETTDHKFIVLFNYIQNGIDFSSKHLADSHAEKLAHQDVHPF